MGKIIEIEGCKNIHYEEEHLVELINQNSYFINTDFIYEITQFGGNCIKVVLEKNDGIDFIITEQPMDSLIRLINGK